VAFPPLVVEGDMHSLRFADGSFDIVYTNVIDHAYDLPKALAEMARVLRPGGLLVVDTFLRRKVARLGDGSLGHYASVICEDAREVVASARGLRLERHEHIRLPGVLEERFLFRKAGPEPVGAAMDAWHLPREAICPRDVKGLERWDGGLYREIYRIKHAIALELRPRSILEIGVRAGYSALAFLAASPKAKYVGLDAENGQHGGAGGPWTPWAVELLRPYDATVRVVDTQTIGSLAEWDMTLFGGGSFDLVHVDADHSKAGCMHDMGLAFGVLAPGGAVLVDDYHFLGGVRRAVDAFAEARGLDLEVRRSPRGEAILRVKKAGS